MQLTSDGHAACTVTVPTVFGHAVDYAQLQKIYGPDPKEDQRRYSPAQCLGPEKRPMIGNPDEAHISTSYIERSKMTPALASNVSDRLWSIDDVVALVDAHDAAKPRQKPGRKPKTAQGASHD